MPDLHDHCPVRVEGPVGWLHRLSDDGRFRLTRFSMHGGPVPLLYRPGPGSEPAVPCGTVETVVVAGDEIRATATITNWADSPLPQRLTVTAEFAALKHRHVNLDIERVTVETLTGEPQPVVVDGELRAVVLTDHPTWADAYLEIG